MRKLFLVGFLILVCFLMLPKREESHTLFKLPKGLYNISCEGQEKFNANDVEIVNDNIITFTREVDGSDLKGVIVGKKCMIDSIKN